ncbi:MAG: cysteine hydrolase [Proteobacteria bacterium]|jgi:nicotinamidase-related amidase|nr:cysteine hydrolase [Pseudomonadota bacterium]MDA1136058.1 cysteine hydrolase [Pseudomonadota bacterium]
MKQNNFSDYTKKMNNLLDISIDNVCVLTVDMQNEYLNPKYGTSPLANDDIESITKNTNDFLMKMRKNDVPIIHCYVVRRKEELNHNFFISPYIDVSQSNNLSQNAQASARKKPERVEGTMSSKLPDLFIGKGDFHVTSKRNFDSFHETELHQLISRIIGLKNILICGVNTDTCVYGTAFGASNRGYKPILIRECTGSMRGKDQHLAALDIMSRSIAWVLNKNELYKKLNI